MTAKHFAIVARVIRHFVEDQRARKHLSLAARTNDERVARKLAERFALEFSVVNLRFKPDVFMRACGFTPKGKG